MGKRSFTYCLTCIRCTFVEFLWCGLIPRFWACTFLYVKRWGVTDAFCRCWSACCGLDVDGLAVVAVNWSSCDGCALVSAADAGPSRGGAVLSCWAFNRWIACLMPSASLSAGSRSSMSLNGPSQSKRLKYFGFAVPNWKLWSFSFAGVNSNWKSYARN